MLSDGNVRIQFNLEENIRMSQYGLEALEDFGERMAVGDWRPDPAPRHQGNLFLTDDAHRHEAEVGLQMQRSSGLPRSSGWRPPRSIGDSLPTR